MDDSLVMRKAISRLLSKDSSIQVVDTAADGRDAIDKIGVLKPDVVTMDIEMPVMDGLEALKRIMANNPIPVIMMSALTKEGADITMEALNLGACDYVTKDFANINSSLAMKQTELVSKVKNVAKNKVKFLLRKLDVTRKPIIFDPDKNIKHEVVSIGASTGGPPALQHILAKLPESFPVPIVIAQHMPKLFTQSFSQRLNTLSQLQVKEAEENEPLRPGVALVAPGDTHVALKKKGKEVVVEFLNDSRFIYRPSVDILMSSTAAVFQEQSIGVILTGMGSDGLNGMKEIRSRNGYIIAQDEETCVVYGMPRAVVNADLADAILPIDKISEEVMRIL